jgi:sulfoxide reductase heme-binding subunit YedZ
MKAYAWLAPAVWAGGAVPLVVMAIDAKTGGLGANPVSQALNQLGLLALVSLVASLTCTPLASVTKWTWPPRIRRALGVWSFFFATTHLFVYVVLDQGGKGGALVEDVLKRPFVTVGFLAWLLMVPLAATSFPSSIRELGFAKWKRLHSLVFVIVGLALVHFIWRVKKDLSEPLAYTGVVALLIVVRLNVALAKRRKARPASS